MKSFCQFSSSNDTVHSTIVLLLCFGTALSFSVSPFPQSRSNGIHFTSMRKSTDFMMSIVSPFDSENGSSTEPLKVDDMGKSNSGPFDLTEENVEIVLDEMRPYLIQDGGNVELKEIDGPVVRLELVGACGTCPSSTQTLKMGLERGLKEVRICKTFRICFDVSYCYFLLTFFSLHTKIISTI